MGVVLWIMLTGSHPWPIHDDPIAGVQSISFGPEWDGISKVAIELIKSMLEIDPAARITSSSEALVEHPWLSGDGINWFKEEVQTPSNYNHGLQRAPHL